MILIVTSQFIMTVLFAGLGVGFAAGMLLMYKLK